MSVFSPTVFSGSVFDTGGVATVDRQGGLRVPSNRATVTRPAGTYHRSRVVIDSPKGPVPDDEDELWLLGLE